MQSYLLSVDKFDAYTPYTVEILDLVDFWLAQDIHIDLCTQSAGRAMNGKLDELKKTGRFRVISEEQGDIAPAYDLIFIWRGFVSQKLMTALHEQRLSGPIVFRHFSDYNDLYIPYGVQLENDLASLTLGLSTLTCEQLKLTGIAEDQLALMPWLVPQRFIDYQAQARSTELKQILYVAPEMSAEIYELQQKAADIGVTLHWLDEKQQLNLVEPEWLSQYDVIIANESLVAKSLALGIPVFLAVNGYVDDYIDADNIAAHEHNHFSGMSLRNSPDSDEWLSLLQNGYQAAARWTRDNRVQWSKTWGIKEVLARIFTSSFPVKKTVLDQKSCDALTLHRKALLAHQSLKYSMSRWLEDRKISEARRDALLSITSDAPGADSIGVVVISRNGDAEACQRTLASVSMQSLPAESVDVIAEQNFASGDRPLIGVGKGWAESLNALLNQRKADALLVVPAGFTLTDDALLHFAAFRVKNQKALAVYCDEMLESAHEEPLLTLRPGTNIDLLRATPYPGQTWLINREAALQVGGVDSRFQEMALIDLIWRFVEAGGSAAFDRVAEVLVSADSLPKVWQTSAKVLAEHRLVVIEHLERLGITASLEEGNDLPRPRIRYHWDVKPLVSIIIPTRDHVALLRRCIESLMEKTQYSQYELLIVDNQSVEADACDFLGQLERLGIDQVRVLRHDAPFNFAQMNNLAAQYARGEILLFLNNDCEIIDGNWLEAMVEHALRPEIALVGARLEYADGRVQHGGYLTGIQQGVGVAFEGVEGDSSGFEHFLKTPHNLNAVSASCMMVRKDVFFSLNGFTEEVFPLYFADVDLSLRAQAQGYLNIWTPYARVKHMGGATRLLSQKFHVQERPLVEDYSALYQEWRQALLADPSYHPLMQKAGTPFTLSENTARFHEPLPGRPLPVILAHHINWQGNGHHRVLQPFKAMERHTLLEGGLVNAIPGLMEVAQLQPDVVLLELPTGSRFPDVMQQMRNISGAKIVVEYDDYLLNLPMKNGNNSKFPQHMAKSLRKIMDSADWVVVSTAPLAEAYSRFHSDIRIAQNRLAPDQWGHLRSLSGTGKKVRVGWAGGSSHAGDLEILLPLIKELEHEVEWVFMGMKPKNVRCEFHPGVPFEMYPEKLASLNLDLALVPLELNHFNECKSNLRLLEIGTCGVPIIATDIEPYRCDLPVTLVENRFKNWMSAIRAHISDAQYLVSQGDKLREAIHRDWYLRNNGLDDWRKAWLMDRK